MVENCPKPDWHLDRHPGNLAYPPELWEWIGSVEQVQAGLALAHRALRPLTLPER